MDILELIYNMLGGNLKVYPCLEGKEKDEAFKVLPTDLFRLLAVCNGVEEICINPLTHEKIPVEWIVMPYEKIIKSTMFYRNMYKIKGFVFADDGVGNPFIIKESGMIATFNCIDGKEEPICANLADFFTL